MKDHQRDFRDYLNDILVAIQDIKSYIKKLDFDSFLIDRKTNQAVVRNFEIIGEAAKNLPVYLRKNYISIQWKEIMGMRDKIVHEYFGIDLRIVWDAIWKDFPPLEKEVKRILKKEEKKKQN